MVSNGNGNSEKRVEYSSIVDPVISLLKSLYNYAGVSGEEREKHYAYDPETRKIVPYSRELLGIHLRGKIEKLDSELSVTVNNIEFKAGYKLVFIVELTTKSEVVEGQFEIPVYRDFVSGWRNEKQAWAIAFSTIRKHKLDEAKDFKVFPHYYRGRKSKYDEMMIIALPASELQRVEQWFAEQLKKLLPEETEEAETEEEEPEKPIELPPLPEPTKRKLTLVPPEAQTATTPAVVPQPQPEKPERAELVKIYLLSMRLPSKYLVQDVKVESSEKTNMTREVRKWEGIKNDLASKLERIRTDGEKMARRIFCHIEEYGVWIAVSEEAVEEARRISAFVTQKLQELMPQLSQFKNIDISRYFVKAVSVYIEPDDARELLDAAIRKLSEDVNELAEKIKKAEDEKNKKALHRLQQDYNYRRNLLEVFRKYLESLPK
jgi:hemerythrin-like domain-containing protein